METRVILVTNGPFCQLKGAKIVPKGYSCFLKRAAVMTLQCEAKFKAGSVPY